MAFGIVVNGKICLHSRMDIFKAGYKALGFQFYEHLLCLCCEQGEITDAAEDSSILFVVQKVAI